MLTSRTVISSPVLMALPSVFFPNWSPLSADLWQSERSIPLVGSTVPPPCWFSQRHTGVGIAMSTLRFWPPLIKSIELSQILYKNICFFKLFYCIACSKKKKERKKGLIALFTPDWIFLRESFSVCQKAYQESYNFFACSGPVLSPLGIYSKNVIWKRLKLIRTDILQHYLCWKQPKRPITREQFVNLGTSNVTKL